MDLGAARRRGLRVIIILIFSWIHFLTVNMDEEDDSHSYTITKKLSSGAFGTVYRGICKATGEDVAIKVEKNANY
jgi:serine/threonine protein kinase